MKLLATDVDFNATPIEMFERDANLGENIFNLDQEASIVILAPDDTVYENGLVPVTFDIDKFPGLSPDHPSVLAAVSRTYSRRVKATQRPLAPLEFAPTHVLVPDPNSGIPTYVRLRIAAQWRSFIRNLNKTLLIAGPYTTTPDHPSNDLSISAGCQAISTDRFVKGNESYVTGPVVTGSADVTWIQSPDGTYEINFPPGRHRFSCYCPYEALIEIDASQSNQIDALDTQRANYMSYHFTNNPEYTFDDVGPVFNEATLKTTDFHIISATAQLGYNLQHTGNGFVENLNSYAYGTGNSPDKLWLGILLDNQLHPYFYYQVNTLDGQQAHTSTGSNSFLASRSDASPYDGMFMHTIFSSMAGGILRMKRLSTLDIYNAVIYSYGLVHSTGEIFSSDGQAVSGRQNKWAVTKIQGRTGIRDLYISPSMYESPWSFRDSAFSFDGLDASEISTSHFRVQWEPELGVLSVIMKGLDGSDLFYTNDDGRIPAQVSYNRINNTSRLYIRFDDDSFWDSGSLTVFGNTGKYIRVSGPIGVGVNPERNFVFA